MLERSIQLNFVAHNFSSHCFKDQNDAITLLYQILITFLFIMLRIFISISPPPSVHIILSCSMTTATSRLFHYSDTKLNFYSRNIDSSSSQSLWYLIQINFIFSNHNLSSIDDWNSIHVVVAIYIFFISCCQSIKMTFRSVDPTSAFAWLN